MAHFAKLSSSGMVIDLLVVGDDILIDPETGNEVEQQGINWLTEWSGGHPYWVQYSYNTHQGIHYDPVTNTPDDGKAFRWNAAMKGGTYDAVRDAFIPPKIKDSDVLNEEKLYWESTKFSASETQNGPTQTETPHYKAGAPNGYWDWDPDRKTWYLKTNI